jgi:hypothetical protein
VEENEMQVERRTRRIETEIPVTVTTVLASVEASITNLAEHGAQIIGVTAPEGTRIQIDYLEQTIFAITRWSEVDRMGVGFLFPLAEGQLYERLMLGRATRMNFQMLTGAHMAMAPMQQDQAPLGARKFSRVPLAAGFGRRN